MKQISANKWINTELYGRSRSDGRDRPEYQCFVSLDDADGVKAELIETNPTLRRSV